MTGGLVSVVTQNDTWCESLREAVEPLWSVAQYDDVPHCLQHLAPTDCVLLFPEGPIEFEDHLRISREILRREAGLPVVFLIDEDCSLSSDSCWKAGAAAVFAAELTAAQLATHLKQLIGRWRPLSQVFNGLWEFQNRKARLSTREHFIMERIVDGWWIKQIARQLGTSPNTVRNQRAKLLSKLQIRSDRELIRWALASRLAGAMTSARGLSEAEGPEA